MINKTCLIVSTFGAVPYVHLSLHSLRDKKIDLIVHDDFSPKQKELKDLCRIFNARFVSNNRRLGHFNGDLSAIIYGLKLNNYNHFIKMSRRFTPLSIVDEILGSLDKEHATYSSISQRLGILRTECIAFNIKKWRPHVLNLEHEVVVESQWNWVELTISKYAQNIFTINGLGNDRYDRNDKFLWHDWATPQDYFNLSQQYGLKYSLEDFAL